MRTGQPPVTGHGGSHRHTRPRLPAWRRVWSGLGGPTEAGVQRPHEAPDGRQHVRKRPPYQTGRDRQDHESHAWRCPGRQAQAGADSGREACGMRDCHAADGRADNLQHGAGRLRRRCGDAVFHARPNDLERITVRTQPAFHLQQRYQHLLPHQAARSRETIDREALATPQFFPVIRPDSSPARTGGSIRAAGGSSQDRDDRRADEETWLHLVAFQELDHFPVRTGDERDPHFRQRILAQPPRHRLHP